MKRVDTLDRTNRALLEVLDLRSDNVSPDDMASLLRRVTTRWSHMVPRDGSVSGFYREAPGEDGAHSALAGQLEQERAQGLGTERAKTFQRTLGEVLQLGDAQTETLVWYFLRQHYLRIMSSRTRDQAFRFGLDDDLTQVLLFFNMERVSALKCMAALFRIGMDAQHRHARLAQAEMAKLLASDVLHRTLALYHAQANAQMPTSTSPLSDAQRAIWVSRIVEEQVACLELVFLILYSQEHFRAAQFVELVTVFEQQAFGVSQLSRAQLSAEARDAVATIGHLAVLCLLTSLNFESMLQDERALDFVGRELFPEDDSVRANVDMLRTIDERLALWGRIHHQGPVLLAWAAFHCRIEQVCAANTALRERLAALPAVRDYLASVQYRRRAATAFNIRVMRFLSGCAASLRAASEHNLVGYLSVLKQLLSATLTAFDVAQLPHFDDFVSFACRIFAGQPALCAQFWAWDASHAARGSLLRLAQERFPLDTLSWLRLLRALACEPAAAVHVLNSVQSLDTFTQTLPPAPRCGASGCVRPASLEVVAGPDTWLACDEHVVDVEARVRQSARGIDVRLAPLATTSVANWIRVDGRDATAVVADRDIVFPEDGVRVTATTRGRLTAADAIMWRGVRTGWPYLVTQLQRFIKPRAATGPAQADVERASTILALVDRLLVTNDQVARALPAYAGCAAADFVALLFQLVESAALLSPVLSVRKLVARALRCTTRFVSTFPADVWQQFGRRALLEPVRSVSVFGSVGALGASGMDDFYSSSSSSSSSSSVGGGSNGAVRKLLQSEELPQGRYSVTLAFLGLVKSLLGYLLQWRLGSGVASAAESAPPVARAADLMRCLNYVRADVLSSYYSWKFVRVNERWQMGIQILSILHEVLTDVRPRRQDASLRSALLDSLDSDSSFHHVLLSVVGIGHDVLLKKTEVGQFADRDTLEQLVVSGLMLLHNILGEHRRQSVPLTGIASAPPMHGVQPSPSFVSAAASSSLEHGLLTRTVGTDGMYLVLVIAQYVHYPHAGRIPLLAVQVLAQLCNVSSTPSNKPPSLLGYLGDAAVDVRQTLLELLATSADPLVRIAILRLIGAAVDHQPGLAETLLTSPEDGGSGGSGTGIGGGVNTRSAVQVIMDMLSRRALYEHHPQLLSEALALLHSLWSRAPNHTSILRSIRQEGLGDGGRKLDFWATVTQCLDLDRVETHERWADIFHKNLAHHFEAQNDETRPLQATQAEQQRDIGRYCYNTLLHSIVLRIIALECYYASDALDDELKQLLFKMRDSMQVRWFNEYTRFFFPSMKRRFERACSAIGLDPVVLAHARTDRTYGGTYIYDAQLLASKLGVGAAHEQHRELLVLMAETNNQLSVADAQIVLLESWKTLLQVGVAKIPGKLIDASRGPEMGVKLIHGFQNKVESRFRAMERLAPMDNPYLLDVVLADLLDIGQHFTRVYLEPLLLGDPKLVLYLVRVYAQVFRFQVAALERLQQTGTADVGGGSDDAPSQRPRVQSVTMREMLRVKRATLTTVASVMLLFVHHQPEVIRRLPSDADTRAVWQVVFTEVLSLVPSLSQPTCVVLEASSDAEEDTRMLMAVALALLTAVLRNLHTAGGAEYLLYADLGRSGFVAHVVAAIGKLLDRPELGGASVGARNEPEEVEVARSRTLALLELLLHVSLALSGQTETAPLLLAADLFGTLCDSRTRFFSTLHASADVATHHHHHHHHQPQSQQQQQQQQQRQPFSAAQWPHAQPSSFDGGDPLAAPLELSVGFSRVWCLIMSTVAQLVQHTPARDAPVLRGAMAFAAAHRRRMVHVLTSALRAPYVVTLASVQESRRVLQLFFALSAHMSAWKLFSHGVVVELERAALAFVSQGCFLLGRPETLLQYCRPGHGLDGPLMADDGLVSGHIRGGGPSEQRAGAATTGRRLRSSLAPGLLVLSGTTSSPLEDGGDPALGLSFAERIQSELFDALRTCLAFLRHDAPSLWRVSRVLDKAAGPLQLVPLVGVSVERPVSMGDEPSLGTLEWTLAVLVQQLADFFAKASLRLDVREVDVMSVSRIESSAALVEAADTEDSSSSSSSGGSNTSGSTQQARAEKKAKYFLRACHVLLYAIEESVFLAISHAHYYLARESAALASANGTMHAGGNNASSVSTAADGSMTLAQSQLQRHRAMSGPGPTVSSRIVDELSASVLRSLLKLERLLSARLVGSPQQESELLREKLDFVVFATAYFRGLGAAVQ